MVLSADPYIYGEFVYNLNLDLSSNPFLGLGVEDFNVQPGEDYEQDVVKSLLEEARWVFSAMIYGLKITYTPSDLSRSVNRMYESELLAEIAYGDPRLEVYDTSFEDNQFYIFIRYKLDSYQQRRIDYWGSGVFESAAAYGTSPLFSENSRVNAIKDAIRIALENQLKPDEFNKPRIIEAEVLLRGSPVISIDAGRSRAFVRIRTDIKNVQHYRVNN